MQVIILLQIVKGYISASIMQNNNWGYSSVVEHSTADREVPGSNPGVPFHFLHMQVIILLQMAKGYISASMICKTTTGDIAQW